SESASHVVFTTPELAFTLFASLDPHDLTQCIRVCKDWMHHAEPVLWRNFCYGGLRRKRLSSSTTSGLIRNLPYVRTVELTVQDLAILQELAHGAAQVSQPDASAADPCAPCTHLRRLTLESIDTLGDESFYFEPYLLKDFPPVFSNIVTLLEHNLRLTHLTFPFPDVSSGDPVLAAISNLKGLQYLAVNSNGSSEISTWSLSLLLRACLPLPELTELCINCKVHFVKKVDDVDVPDLETILKEAAIARFSHTPIPGKIKALQLPQRAESSRHPLALAFLKSDLLDLESFMVPPFEDESNSGEVQLLVRDRCPNLKHLRCPALEGYLDECRYMRAFIRGCSGLQSFASDNFCDNRYIDHNDSYVPRGIMSDLLWHHSDTLEVFELKTCHQVSSSDLQKVLTQCKRLKRFHVSGRYPETRDRRHHDGDAGFDFKDLSRDDWVCTELRELWITLGLNSVFEENRFYQQLGRLEKLEHLTLDVHRRRTVVLDMWGDDIGDEYFDYTHELRKRSLDAMAGLKNLKSLRLGAELCLDMREDEIERFDKHWPLLSEITVMGSKALKLPTKKRWQWLFNKRPNLRFTVLRSSQMIDAMHNYGPLHYSLR
ncbi:hypothetical protein BGZ70_008079, partial [Mortierella alpina]